METLKKTGIILLLFFVTTLFSLALIWYKPEIIINSRSLDFFRQKIRIHGHRVSWSELDVGIRNIDWRKKHFIIRSRDLCIKGEQQVCISSAIIDFQLNLNKTGLHIKMVNEFTLRDVSIVYKTDTAIQTNTSHAVDLPDPKLWIQNFEKLPSVNKLVLNAESIRLINANQELQFSFFAEGRLSQRHLGFSAKFAGLKGHPRWSDKSYLSFQLQSTEDKRLPLELKADILLKGYEGEIVASSVLANHSWPQLYPLKIQGSTEARLKDFSASFGHFMTYRPLRLDGNVDGVFNGTNPPVVAEFHACRLNAAFSSPLKDLIINCPVSISAQESLYRDIPGKEHLITSIKGILNIAFSGLTMDELGPGGEVKITFNSEKGGPLELEGIFSSGIPPGFVNGSGDLSEIRPHLEISVRLSDVKRLFLLLEKLDVGAPAPFHSLRGPLQFEIEHSFDKKLENQWRLPFKLATDLSSPNQHFKSAASGDLTITQEKQITVLNLTAQVEIQEAKLILPNIGPRIPPRLFPDDRIQSAQEKKAVIKEEENDEEEVIFNYQLDIKTDKKSPIYVQSDRAIDLIPVNLELQIESDAPLAGSILLETFRINLFGRDAKIEHFYLKPKKGENAIDGKLTVTYADYEVYVYVAGTTEGPTINFDSEPPLSEEDIISTLLFGYPLEDTSQEQSDSVSNMQAAAADRALGLASLYLFASTPIESIRYNPALNRYTAKIRISKGTSLIVGSAEEQGAIYGARRRLSKGLYLSTEYQSGDEKRAASTTALLEWIMRY